MSEHEVIIVSLNFMFIANYAVVWINSLQSGIIVCLYMETHSHVEAFSNASMESALPF